MCEHAFAKYPTNPRTGRRLSQKEFGEYGAFAYGLDSFCMHCGAPKEEDHASCHDQPE